MSNKKLWIISEFYYPIVTSTGYYMTEIAEYLAKKGLDIGVLSTGAKYNETDSYIIRKTEKLNGVSINRVLVGNIDKNNFYKRAIRLLWASLCLILLILKKVKKNEEILIVTNPAFLILFMPIIAKVKKCKYTLLVHDIFPENLVAIGKLKKTSLKYKVFKYIFNTAYSKADRCISIGRDMSEIIRNKIKKSGNIVYIPNWADNEEVYPVDKRNTNMYSDLNLKDKFIFQFAGNLGNLQGLDNILKAIKMIDNNNIQFLFIGGGAKYNLIKEISSKDNNITLVGFQERSQQNDFLNACDVAIVTLADGMYGLGVPSKSYNIMAAGKPILLIADEDSEIGRCIKEFNLGWIVRPDDPIELSSIINKISKRDTDFELMKSNARKVAEEDFSKNNILNRYYQLFK